MLIIGTKEGNQSQEKTANYELNEGDHKNIVVFTSATNVICTIPKGLRIGFSCTIVQKGTGKVSFSAPASDAYVNGGDNTIQTKGAWAWAKVLCINDSDYTVEFGGAADGSGGGGSAGTLSQVLAAGYAAPTQNLLVRKTVVDKAHGVEFANGPEVNINTGTTKLKALENTQDNYTTLYLPKNVTNKKLAISVAGEFADDNGNIPLVLTSQLGNRYSLSIFEDTDGNGILQTTKL